MRSDHYFEDLGDGRFRSTSATAGPWSPDAQHGGPPAALLARALERYEARDDMMFARLSYEILGSVPVAELTVRTRISRPGRSVELVEAAAEHDGRDVMTVRGWRIKRTDRQTPVTPPSEEPGDATALLAAPGYLGSVDWRPVHGSFREIGPAAVWTRLKVAVVDGEQPSPLQRVVTIADSGNGMSSMLDLEEYYFINPELSVHLHREPAGEWVKLDASTTISRGGSGLATSVLSDRTGPIGVGAQALYVQAR